MALSTLTLLYNHHYFQLPEIFISNRNIVPLSNNSASAPASGNCCSVSIYMTIFGSYKWNHILFALLCLAYFIYFHHTVLRDFFSGCSKACNIHLNSFKFILTISMRYRNGILFSSILFPPFYCYNTFLGIIIISLYYIYKCCKPRNT